MVKIKHPARRQVEPVAAGGIVKVAHGLLDLRFHGGALRLEIERPVLKHEVLSAGHIHELHLRRHRAGVVCRQAHAVGLRQRDAPAADAPRRLVDPGHELPAARIVVFSARIVKLAGDTCEQGADCLAVLPGNIALPLPEVLVADALIVADVQKFVRRDVHEIGPDLARALCLVHIARSFHQITVERPQDGPEHDGAGRGPVGAGAHAVGFFERVRESLIGGKAYFTAMSKMLASVSRTSRRANASRRSRR